MAELVIPPDTATTEGTGTTNDPYIVATDVIGGTVSGTSASAWIDGLDTSYVKSDFRRSSKGNYPNWQTLPSPPDASRVTAIGIRFRARKGAGSSNWFIVQLFGQVAKLLSNPSHGGRLALTFGTDVGWVDFDYVIDPAEYDEGGWAPNGVQSALEQTFLYARTWPATDSTGEFLGDGTIEVAEQRIVLYYDDIDTPCDTWVDLDLSTAVFLENNGTLSGQLVDGQIVTTTDFLQPDFYFPGLTLDPTKAYQVEVTFDPSTSPGSTREVYIAGVRPGHEQDDVDAAYTAGGEWSGAVAVLYDTGFTTTDNVQAFIMGPGRPQGDPVDPVPGWDDATLGVAQGYTAPWFETDVMGAVSAIRIRKVCTVAIPPLRLTNRADRFSSAPSLTRSGVSRQGGNRLTGYL